MEVALAHCSAASRTRGNKRTDFVFGDGLTGWAQRLATPPRIIVLLSSVTHMMELEIDGWIEQLTACKQLSEDSVKRLCDKVR